MPTKKSKENRCQCCNKSLTPPYHLVFDDEGKHRNIATLLFDYIGKLLDETDGRRYAVCDPCLQQLIQCNEFKQKCIQANEVSSDSEEELELQPNLSDAFDNSSLNGDLYQDNEYVVNEYQNGKEVDADEMNVEYLEDSFEDENEYDQSSQIGKKKLPYDFSSVLVKPVFVLETGKIFSFNFEMILNQTKFCQMF